MAAFTGYSGSGKTTLIIALIHALRSRGLTVGAIKHTHHPLNEENRGDTSRFRGAGAEPVILANNGEGVVFGSHGTSRMTYASPADILKAFETDVVLVEGFKSYSGWPVIHIDAEHRPTVEDTLANLDRIWAS